MKFPSLNWQDMVTAIKNYFTKNKQEINVMVGDNLIIVLSLFVRITIM